MAVGSGGHSILHESITQAPMGLERGLEPLWLEKLGPHRPSIVWVGPSARVVWLALLPLIALLAGSSGTATSEFRLDLIHGHRRLVGVSVNCHLKSKKKKYIYIKKKLKKKIDLKGG